MLACAVAQGGYAMTTPLHDEAHALPTEEAIAVGAAIQNIVAHEIRCGRHRRSAGRLVLRRDDDASDRGCRVRRAREDRRHGWRAGGHQDRATSRRNSPVEQYERNRAIEDGSRKLVGVNHAVRDEGKRSIAIHRHDPDVEARQIERLRRLRAGRDGAAVAKALDRLRDAARGGENLVPPCIEAVRTYATHGEMCDALRDVFGAYTPDSLGDGDLMPRGRPVYCSPSSVSTPTRSAST